MLFQLVTAALILLNIGSAYAARVVISINEHSQKMTVSIDGQQEYVWPVSTGIAPYATPGGVYTPFRMEEFHFSEEWDDAPMPHSIFFTRLGHAIHGTEHVEKLGRRASHGCVRLDPDNAATLFRLVEEVGMPNTSVVVMRKTNKKARMPTVAARKKKKSNTAMVTQATEKRTNKKRLRWPWHERERSLYR